MYQLYLQGRGSRKDGYLALNISKGGLAREHEIFEDATETALVLDSAFGSLNESEHRIIDVKDFVNMMQSLSREAFEYGQNHSGHSQIDYETGLTLGLLTKVVSQNLNKAHFEDRNLVAYHRPSRLEEIRPVRKGLNVRVSDGSDIRETVITHVNGSYRFYEGKIRWRELGCSFDQTEVWFAQPAPKEVGMRDNNELVIHPNRIHPVWIQYQFTGNGELNVEIEREIRGTIEDFEKAQVPAKTG